MKITPYVLILLKFKNAIAYFEFMKTTQKYNWYDLLYIKLKIIIKNSRAVTYGQ